MFGFFYWRDKHGPVEPYCIGGSKYRREPIPGIHKSGGYGYFRYPRTLNELRASYAFNDNERREYKMRLTRGHYNIPTSWDDLPRSDWRDRSWKRHRRHQWKDRG